MRGSSINWRQFAVVLLGVALAASAARGQIDGVLLEVDSDYVGLGGMVRPGTWTPIRLTLENQGADPRKVICQWLLEDNDGDRVAAQRLVTINPQLREHVWLYANPPVSTRANATWTLQVLDAKSQKLLASKQVVLPRQRMLGPGVNVLGVLSAADLGLRPYLSQFDHPDSLQVTAHERVELVRGLSLEDLPDRWYGLSMFSSIIWTKEGGDPDDAKISAQMQEALRQWVQRGGHLVIMLPALKRQWPGSSLADMLPVEPEQIRMVEDYPPIKVVGYPRAAASKRVKIQMTVFDVGPGDSASVLARDGQGNALIVAGRYGFGTVTLVGIDLSDRRLVRMGLPAARKYQLWNSVFGWQTPLYTWAVLEAERKQGMVSTGRTKVNLGRFIPSQIAMRNTAAPALLAAIVVFGLYWVAAGPLSFMLLKKRRALRHSWLLFVAVVTFFTVVAWGGAVMMQPATASISHFSVMDIDAQSGKVHTHSWLSLFVPTFAKTLIEVDPQGSGGHQTLASAGLLKSIDSGGFIDPQGYAIESASPNAATVPYRSTAKQFEINYLGKLDPNEWVVPQGTLTMGSNGFPVGRLTHDLPGPLRDVLFVYCPGVGGANNQAQTPWVWRSLDATGKMRMWHPGKTLVLDERAVSRSRLIAPPTNRDFTKRSFNLEGFLGALIGRETGKTMIEMPADKLIIPSDQMIMAIEMLSFFDALPPPDFRSKPTLGRSPAAYQRYLGRQLDLTALTTGKRMIIIGHLDASPLPVPLAVDGQQIESSGWTVVRWIYDLE